ncbi:GNAT family N-acetyltransferase [Kitasatospora sp. NPDC050463]|uniref:GNAT family N-acetyltransferase n=1 Tax=Kitasatospora sp. NPDC050463 TaxID=3155786 RepID=UPI0033FF8D98
MSASPTPLSLRRYGAGDTGLLLDTLADIWADAHAGHDDVALAGFTPTTLRRQITGHARRDDFTLIAGYDMGEIVGFGYGFRATPAYWYGEQLLPHITPPEARTTDSLAGICELAVRIEWQGRGVGTRIHAALLEALGTEWVSLLAMPGDERPEQRLYRQLVRRTVPGRPRRTGTRPPPAAHRLRQLTAAANSAARLRTEPGAPCPRPPPFHPRDKQRPLQGPAGPATPSQRGRPRSRFPAVTLPEWSIRPRRAPPPPAG